MFEYVELYSVNLTALPYLTNCFLLMSIGQHESLCTGRQTFSLKVQHLSYPFLYQRVSAASVNDCVDKFMVNDNECLKWTEIIWLVYHHEVSFRVRFFRDYPFLLIFATYLCPLLLAFHPIFFHLCPQTNIIHHFSHAYEKWCWAWVAVPKKGLHQPTFSKPRFASEANGPIFKSKVSYTFIWALFAACQFLNNDFLTIFI